MPELLKPIKLLFASGLIVMFWMVLALPEEPTTRLPVEDEVIPVKVTAVVEVPKVPMLILSAGVV